MIGDRYSFSIKSATGSDTLINLHPTWDYKERLNINRKFMYSQGGQLNTYTLAGNNTAFDFPLAYVSSGDANSINTWWKNDTKVHLNINTNVNTIAYPSLVTFENFEFNIINVQEPFSKRVQSQYTVFDGLLSLRRQGILWVPFILDDDYYGLLDKDYNRLI